MKITSTQRGSTIEHWASQEHDYVLVGPATPALREAAAKLGLDHVYSELFVEQVGDPLRPVEIWWTWEPVAGVFWQTRVDGLQLGSSWGSREQAAAAANGINAARSKR